MSYSTPQTTPTFHTREIEGAGRTVTYPEELRVDIITHLAEWRTITRVIENFSTQNARDAVAMILQEAGLDWKVRVTAGQGLEVAHFTFERVKGRYTKRYPEKPRDPEIVVAFDLWSMPKTTRPHGNSKQRWEGFEPGMTIRGVKASRQAIGQSLRLWVKRKQIEHLRPKFSIRVERNGDGRTFSVTRLC